MALRFSVPVDRYLLFKSRRICLDLFGDTPSLLIGSNVMVNKLLIYDRDTMKLGVADLDCDSLLSVDDEVKVTEPKVTEPKVTTKPIATTETTKKAVAKVPSVPVPE